jgi:hypothetical protein
MRLIQEAAHQELVWRKPSAFKEHDERCAGDDVPSREQEERSMADGISTALRDRCSPIARMARRHQKLG